MASTVFALFSTKTSNFSSPKASAIAPDALLSPHLTGTLSSALYPMKGSFAAVLVASPSLKIETECCFSRRILAKYNPIEACPPLFSQRVAPSPHPGQPTPFASPAARVPAYPPVLTMRTFDMRTATGRRPRARRPSPETRPPRTNELVPTNAIEATTMKSHTSQSDLRDRDRLGGLVCVFEDGPRLWRMSYGERLSLTGRRYLAAQT
mmetsp:Transcript_56263/g.138175  ORF Transcript_56263/g.138175 Transcript_56263/m.138175 type:complete len:208 (-) Transcript_56263:735-1358(-)